MCITFLAHTIPPIFMSNDECLLTEVLLLCIYEARFKFSVYKRILRKIILLVITENAFKKKSIVRLKQLQIMEANTYKMVKLVQTYDKSK